MAFHDCCIRVWQELDENLTGKALGGPDRCFAPAGITRDVFDERTLKDLLVFACPELADIQSKDRLQSIISKVRGSRESPTFYNILATLVYARCDQDTFKVLVETLSSSGELSCVDNLPSDSKLPISEDEARSLFGDAMGSYFWHFQFLFTPVVLSLNSNYPDGCRLPFVKDPRHLDAGGYGDVSEVEVERGHMRIDDMHNRKASELNRMVFKLCLIMTQSQLYAQKVLKRKEDFKAEASILRKILDATGSHKNVALPIASLEMGNHYSLFFNLAKYSLDAYFSDNIVSFSTTGERRETFFRTIGLAGALAFLHDGLISSLDAKISQLYHLDVKPGNILIFETNGGEIWKLTDFGISKFKLKQVYHLSSTTKPRKPTSGVSAPCYGLTCAAPEAKNEGDKVSQEADVWSLGCVIALVLTFIDSQSAGMTRFTEIREENREDDRFFTKTEAPHGSESTYIVYPRILDWLNDLVTNATQRDKSEGDAFQQAVDLLRDHVLLPNPGNRIRAKSLEGRLIQIYAAFQNALALDPVPEKQDDSFPKIGSISSAQAKPSKDPPQNASNPLATVAVDARYDFKEGTIPGRPIKVQVAVMTALKRWLEGSTSSTLWVQNHSTGSQQQVALALARHLKAEITAKCPCRVLYFCNPTRTKVPTLDFLTFVNRQLAGLDPVPAGTSQRKGDLTDATSTYDELCQRLECAVGESVRPVFGIFHNMSWLYSSAEDDGVALHEILDAFKKIQSIGFLKLLYTTTDGTATGIQNLEAAITRDDKMVASSKSGPCPLTQLPIPSYQP